MNWDKFLEVLANNVAGDEIMYSTSDFKEYLAYNLMFMNNNDKIKFVNLFTAKLLKEIFKKKRGD